MKENKNIAFYLHSNLRSGSAPIPFKALQQLLHTNFIFGVALQVHYRCAPCGLQVRSTLIFEHSGLKLRSNSTPAIVLHSNFIFEDALQLFAK